MVTWQSEGMGHDKDDEVEDGHPPFLVEDSFPWGRLDEVISEEVDEALEAVLAVDEWLKGGTPSIEVEEGLKVNCPHCGGIFEVIRNE
jgi:hypothetical protein